MTAVHARKPHAYYTLCGREILPDYGAYHPRIGPVPTCKKCLANQ